MDIDQNLVMTLGGGFFGGILIGYALKKIIKILSIVVGLFLAGLAYLQSQEIAKINWDKLQSVSQGAISNLANATTQISNNIGGNDHAAAAMAMANFGIPLTGSMATGFAVGFMKG
jgi:uncharacterized membrane protein (Fun14 family)